MKKLIFSIVIIGIIFMTSGCFKRDDLEGATVYTTIYPIKYIVQELYGENSIVKSIYPKGVDVLEYPISDKKIKDSAKESELFIYNGLSNEKEMAVKFLNNNKKIRIIDASQGLKIAGSVEELWLSPSNYLMLALNVKNGLKEYIDNTYIHQEIEENYNELKSDISLLEAELKVIADNAKSNTIVVTNDSLLFLSKYGFDVISIDNNVNEVSDATKTQVKKLISDKKISYIFRQENTKETELLRDLIVNTKVEVVILDVITNLKEDQDENTTNYIAVMRENAEKIRNSLYEK